MTRYGTSSSLTPATCSPSRRRTPPSSSGGLATFYHRPTHSPSSQQQQQTSSAGGGGEDGGSGQNNQILRKIVGHSDMLSSLNWLPDDSRLSLCGYDQTIRLWDIATGECVRVFTGHSKNITACAWMPDGKHFVSGAADAKILEWDSTSGSVTATYEAHAHVNDVALARDGRILVATCSDRTVQIFNTDTKKEKSVLTEAVSITSLFLSPKADLLLACTNSNDYLGVTEPEVHVWDLQSMSIIQKFKGFKQLRYVIRGCFGGHNQMFVLCGSEDNRVHIWERTSGNLIAKLDGHKGTVNTVACSEADENLFASGSDDKSVILWGVRKQQQQQQQYDQQQDASNQSQQGEQQAAS